MNDGVKILLERMKTHPEEFVQDPSYGATKWSRLVDFYEHVLTDEEKKAIKDGIIELNRAEFTKKVLEMLMEEPEPEHTIDSFVYNAKDRGLWGSTTLQIQEQMLKQKELEVQQAIQKEYYKLQMRGLASQTKQEKNKSKMEQLLQRMTGSKY
jgi:hypothetical protein